jgi:hypothetical protein
VQTREARSAIGERLGGFIYGTIVVLSVVVAGARAFPDDSGAVAKTVAVTTIVFWLAHVYSHALAHSVTRGGRLSFAELSKVARHEASLIEAGVLPVAALLLGAFGVLSARAALWAAFGVGLAVLAAQGLVFARIERLGTLGTLAVVGTNLALGLALVALKVLVTH